MKNATTQKPDSGTRPFGRVMRLARLALLIVAVFLLIYLINRVGHKELLGILSCLSPAWVLAALFFGFVNLMIAAMRYKSLAAQNVKYWKVFEVILASYLLNYASMVQGIGIGAKVGLLKGHNVSASRSLAGAGGEVIFDLLFTGLVAAIFAGYVGWNKSGLDKLQPAVMGGAAAAAIIIGAGMLFFARVTGFGASMMEGIKRAFSKRHLLINLFSTAGIWVTAAAGYYCMIRAVNVNVPLLLPLAALSVGFVAGLISLVPGGLGVRDLTWAYVCSTAGIPITLTGTAAVVNRLLIILLAALVLGICALFGKRDN